MDDKFEGNIIRLAKLVGCLVVCAVVYYGYCRYMEYKVQSDFEDMAQELGILEGKK